MPPKKRMISVDMDELEARIASIVASKLEPLQTANDNLKEINSQLLDKLNNLLPARSHEPIAATDPPISTEQSPTPYHDHDYQDFELAVNQGSQTLILSDSILRHIGSSCPKKPGDQGPVYDNFHLDAAKQHHVHKIVIPGARCDRLWSEAVLASRDLPDINNIIVSVGANYPNSCTPAFACNEIQDFLSAIARLFPNAQVAWTLTLPQFNRDNLRGIRYLNDQLIKFCELNVIDMIASPEFSLFANNYNSVRSLFAHDGVHLNKEGIKIMESAITNYLFSIYMY
jgi:hypothetical protein